LQQQSRHVTSAQAQTYFLLFSVFIVKTLT